MPGKGPEGEKGGRGNDIHSERMKGNIKYLQRLFGEPKKLDFKDERIQEQTKALADLETKYSVSIEELDMNEMTRATILNMFGSIEAYKEFVEGIIDTDELWDLYLTVTHRK